MRTALIVATPPRRHVYHGLHIFFDIDSGEKRKICNSCPVLQLNQKCQMHREKHTKKYRKLQCSSTKKHAKKQIARPAMQFSNGAFGIVHDNSRTAYVLSASALNKFAYIA